MKTIDANLLYLMFEQGVIELNKNKNKIDALNVFPVPDGDTGTNMSMTVKYALDELENKKPNNISEITKIISKGCLMGARGNSGVILSQIFRGFFEASKNLTEFDTISFSKALKNSAKVAYKAVLKPVEGTILTVIKDIANFAEQICEEIEDFEEFFEKILIVGNESLKNTQNILPALREAKVVDSGATGLICILNGFEKAILGKFEEKEDKKENVLSIFNENELKHTQANISVEELKYMYCTEFIIKVNENHSDMREEFLKIGDSMVYVPDDNIIKVHIHTDKPDEIFKIALKNGEFIKCKVENMKEQHKNIITTNSKNQIIDNTEVANNEEKDFGFVAVASGSGIADIFKGLKVDEIIIGGQTMNPSIQDITEAINKINAKNIYILPNNSNIILAADKAKELSNKNIYVIPTKTITQGFSAMIQFDYLHSADQNYENMVNSIEYVKSIQVTRAVRDTNVNDIEIKKGNYIGILDGKIVASDENIEETLKKVISEAIDEDTSIISLYYGENVNEDNANKICTELKNMYQDIEFDLSFGNQPVYDYYISVE